MFKVFSHFLWEISCHEAIFCSGHVVDGGPRFDVRLRIRRAKQAGCEVEGGLQLRRLPVPRLHGGHLHLRRLWLRRLWLLERDSRNSSHGQSDLPGAFGFGDSGQGGWLRMRRM